VAGLLHYEPKKKDNGRGGLGGGGGSLVRSNPPPRRPLPGEKRFATSKRKKDSRGRRNGSKFTYFVGERNRGQKKTKGRGGGGRDSLKKGKTRKKRLGEQ